MAVAKWLVPCILLVRPAEWYLCLVDALGSDDESACRDNCRRGAGGWSEWRGRADGGQEEREFMFFQVWAMSL